MRVDIGQGCGNETYPTLSPQLLAAQVMLYRTVIEAMFRIVNRRQESVDFISRVSANTMSVKVAPTSLLDPLVR